MARLPALAAVLLSFTAAAQQPAPAKDPPPAKKEEAQKLEKIEVKGDELAERRESTAAKIIVNSDEITKYGDSNLLDVLKRLPGITVDTGPGGRGGTVRMRGLGTGYTQILVNGERMPPGFTLDNISPDMIERIEIVRGSTAEFSAQAMAGTINVVLKRAVSTLKRELKLGASTSHGRPSENLSGQWADKSGAVSWTIPFNLNRFSFRNDATLEQLAFDGTGAPTQDYTGIERSAGWGAGANIAPRLSWTIGANNNLNLDAFAFINTFRGHFMEDDTPIFGRVPPYVSTDWRTDNDNRSCRLNGQWLRRFAGGSRIDAKAGVNYGSYRFDSTYVALDASGRDALDRTVASTLEDRTGTTVGKYTFPIAGSHAISSGWDAAWTERNDVRLQGDVYPLTGVRVRDDQVYDTSVRRLALYAQDEWQATERFSAYGGVRWEGIETLAEGATIDAIRNRSSVTSPIVNMLWKLPGSEKDQVRLGLARTYKPPTVAQLVPRRFFAPINTAVTPDFVGNPRLAPELAWGLDAAYEHYPASGGNMGVSVYHRRIRDIIQQETVLEDGLFVSRPSNIGSGSATGLELDAKGKLSQLWAGGPEVDLRANFALNRSKVSYLPGPNNRLNAQVPWNGTIGADYRMSTTLTFGSSFTAKGAGSVRTSPNQVTYRSVDRQLEAYGLWRLSPSFQVRFSVQDLLAQTMLNGSRYDDAGGLLERNERNARYRRFGLLFELKL